MRYRRLSETVAEGFEDIAAVGGRPVFGEKRIHRDMRYRLQYHIKLHREIVQFGLRRKADLAEKYFL